MSRAFGLKSAPACLLRRLSTPGCRSATGDGCDKPNARKSLPMTLSRPMFPPPPFRPKPIPITALTPDQLAALLDLRRLKKEAESEVERLIAFLDMTDGYTLSERDLAVDDVGCDEDDGLEPDVDDEPSLGSLNDHNGTGAHCSIARNLARAETDCEGPDDDLEPSLCGVTADGLNSLNDDRDREDDGEREPSLGSTLFINQERWAQGNTDEREGDDGNDDKEPNVDDEEDDHGGDAAREDDEPSLGWPEGSMAQSGSLVGRDSTDHELCVPIPAKFIKAARKRFLRFDGFVTNRDGRHILVERWITRSYIRNLSDRQTTIIKPRIEPHGSVGLRR